MILLRFHSDSSHNYTNLCIYHRYHFYRQNIDSGVLHLCSIWTMNILSSYTWRIKEICIFKLSGFWNTTSIRCIMELHTLQDNILKILSLYNFLFPLVIPFNSDPESNFSFIRSTSFIPAEKTNIDDIGSNTDNNKFTFRNDVNDSRIV